MTAADAVQEVLRFWFGESADDAQVAREQNELWWNATPSTDALVRERFGALYAQAAAGDLDAWMATPAGALALILVLDQFSRHIYRGQPQAFGSDAAARKACLDGIAAGSDRGLRPIERVFFYLPLEHSESAADQERSVELNLALVGQAPDNCREIFRYYAEYATGHRDIIRRFGRFPHRNATLGRANTDEETAYLAAG